MHRLEKPNKLEEAIVIATAAHRGQKRDSGEPYIFHCIRVAQNVLDEYENFYGGGEVDISKEDAAIVAVLHDTLEDTNLSFKDIEDSFGHEVAFYINILSRLIIGEKKESYSNFINRIKMYRATTLVKLADLKDNLRDVKSLPEHKKGIEERYKKAVRELEKI